MQNFESNTVTLKDEIDVNFAGILRGSTVTIFPEFLSKCRPCVPLNEIAQKFTYKD